MLYLDDGTEFLSRHDNLWRAFHTANSSNPRTTRPPNPLRKSLPIHRNIDAGPLWFSFDALEHASDPVSALVMGTVRVMA